MTPHENWNRLLQTAVSLPTISLIIALIRLGGLIRFIFLFLFPIIIGQPQNYWRFAHYLQLSRTTPTGDMLPSIR